MKYISVLYMVLFVVLMNTNLITYASNEKTDMQTIEGKRIVDNDVWNNLNLTYSDKVVDFDSFIVNFDVSSEGKIVIALNNRKIILFDNDKPVGTIEFSSWGSYYVFWNGSNVCLYLVRGDYIVEFTQEGKLIQISEIVDSTDSIQLIHSLKRTSSRCFSNYTYTAKKGAGFFDIFVFENEYIMLEKTDDNTNVKSILYDCGSSVMLLVLFRVIIALIFVSVVLFMVVFMIVSLIKVAKINA